MKEHLNKVPKDHIGHPLFSGVLSESQWETLSKINDSMNQEYKGRNDMLLKRLDVTVQSFTWSERVKVGRKKKKLYFSIFGIICSTIGRFLEKRR